MIVLEATSAVQPMWPEFRGLYIEPLLRAVDRQAMGPVELALVVFRSAEEPNSGVENSGWTTSVAEVRGALNGRVRAREGSAGRGVVGAGAGCVSIPRGPSKGLWNSSGQQVWLW